MARSHPPTLLTLVKRALHEECVVTPGDVCVVAVSGGPDSIALLHSLACVAPKVGLQVHAHGVDHGLRAEASSELELGRRLAEQLGVSWSQESVQVAPKGNLQAAAREVRYASLRRAQQRVGANLLATGHHADDRAETVLERLLRGAGPRGLAVLPARSGNLIRPMIRARRCDIGAHIDRHRLATAEDPSNRDDRFTRVKIRRELLPLLEEWSPAVVEHLCALADQLAGFVPLTVEEPTGGSVELKRAHIEQIRRAQALGQREARVALPGGRRIRLDAQGRPVVEAEPERGAGGAAVGKPGHKPPKSPC